MPSYLSLGGLFFALFLGWVAGMFTYQRSRRWCAQCGVTLTCPHCRHSAGKYRNQRVER